MLVDCGGFGLADARRLAALLELPLMASASAPSRSVLRAVIGLYEEDELSRVALGEAQIYPSVPG